MGHASKQGNEDMLIVNRIFNAEPDACFFIRIGMKLVGFEQPVASNGNQPHPRGVLPFTVHSFHIAGRSRAFGCHWSRHGSWDGTRLQGSHRAKRLAATIQGTQENVMGRIGLCFMDE